MFLRWAVFVCACTVLLLECACNVLLLECAQEPTKTNSLDIFLPEHCLVVLTTGSTQGSVGRGSYRVEVEPCMPVVPHHHALGIRGRIDVVVHTNGFGTEASRPLTVL